MDVFSYFGGWSGWRCSVGFLTDSPWLLYLHRCLWHCVWPWHGTQVPPAAGGQPQSHQHYPLGASLPRPPQQVPALAAGAVPAEPVPTQVLLRGRDLWDRHLRWPDLQRHRPERGGAQQLYFRKQLLLEPALEREGVLGLAQRHGDPTQSQPFPEAGHLHQLPRRDALLLWRGARCHDPGSQVWLQVFGASLPSLLAFQEGRHHPHCGSGRGAREASTGFSGGCSLDSGPTFQMFANRRASPCPLGAEISARGSWLEKHVGLWMRTSVAGFSLLFYAVLFFEFVVMFRGKSLLSDTQVFHPWVTFSCLLRWTARCT